MPERPLLFLGNKNYSSWSMRPWLALCWAGIAFDEKVMSLPGGGYGKSSVPEIRDSSPSGRVPALSVDGIVIWDSLAICAWAAETKPKSGLWPEDRAARAICRSVASEMHSGFTAIRRELPMNLRRKPKPGAAPRELSGDAQKDVLRLEEMWADAKARFNPNGQFLFGARSIADAFFAPVATRFRTYGVVLSKPAQDYCDALLADPGYIDWENAALAEPWVVEAYENS